MAWWADCKGKYRCCSLPTLAKHGEQEADEEEMEALAADGESPCETCDYRIHQESMSRVERLSMSLYNDLARPVVPDLKLTGLVFDIYRLRCTEDEARDLLTCLDIIHQERLNSAKLPAPVGALRGHRPPADPDE